MREHPIKSFARSRSMTLAEVASAAGISRMTLSRVMRGENTTLDLLSRISDATGGQVSMPDLAACYDASRVAGGHEKSRPALSQASAR